MPAIARADGTDKVLSITGSGYKCKFPTTVSTGKATQKKVTAGGVPVVVEGGIVAEHKLPGCIAIDKSPLKTYSSRVSVGGKKVARIADTYGEGEGLNTITSGSSRVFAG